jgi:cell division protein FtsB
MRSFIRKDVKRPRASHWHHERKTSRALMNVGLGLLLQTIIVRNLHIKNQLETHLHRVI